MLRGEEDEKKSERERETHTHTGVWTVLFGEGGEGYMGERRGETCGSSSK